MGDKQNCKEKEKDMKIFIDSANPEEIKKIAQSGLLDGVTTNPTLIAKENADQKKLMEQICKIANVPVNAEPVSVDYDGIIKEAEELTKISDQIVIKIPVIPDGLKAVKKLSAKKIKTTVTLVFSPLQALLAAKAGATYITPFVGRLDDIGENGMDLIKNIVAIYKTYNFKTQIIVASVRTTNHILLSAEYGADAITIPFKLIEKMYMHPLTDIGIKKFIEDARKK
jgi:transaldolase